MERLRELGLSIMVATSDEHEQFNPLAFHQRSALWSRVHSRTKDCYILLSNPMFNRPEHFPARSALNFDDKSTF